MIIKLTPETYFEYLNEKNYLHVVMCYGETCGPCKITMPQYEVVENHFVQYNVNRVKFYTFHQWEGTYRPFIEEHNLRTTGVPTFRYYYEGELVAENARSYREPNELKASILEVVSAIDTTMGGFNIHEN